MLARPLSITARCGGCCAVPVTVSGITSVAILIGQHSGQESADAWCRPTFWL
jgi:hypothetical protein